MRDPENSKHVSQNKPQPRANESNGVQPENRLTLFFYILICMAASAFIVPAALAAGADCPDGISGYWKLEETSAGSYTDKIGGNNGTCQGNRCPSSETGTIGTAQAFGGNDSVSIGAPAAFNWAANQSFTIEMWVRRDDSSVSGVEAFIGRADSGGLNWYVGINSQGNAQAVLRAANGSGPGPLTVSKDLRSSDAGNPTWHHVVFVRNAGSNRNILYVDGELGASAVFQTFTYISNFVSDSAPVTLGALDGGSFFSGGLDEVAVYGRALSATEIKSHYLVSRGYCSRYDSAMTLMPMGDSITSGVMGLDNPQQPEENVRIGYRYSLWEQLHNDLYLFEFRGDQRQGFDFGDPDFDARHAGFPGQPDDFIVTLLTDGYLADNPTEFILLHIGTNGVVTDQSATDVISILDLIDEFDKNVTVVLARIIDQVPRIPQIATFNSNVVSAVADRIADGDKIIVVDMESLLEYRVDNPENPNPEGGDMFDPFHPNTSGYEKLAGEWFETIKDILPKSDLPAFTSKAVRVAAKDEPYTYTATATGPPRPTYELTDNPAPGEMTINATTGLIQWTPNRVGEYDVEVTATNWTGKDVQNFTISVIVNAPPVAMPDAYNGVEEGKTLDVGAADGVLKNDTDDDNDPLTASLVSNVKFGTLTLNSDGSFTYTHDDSENFNDSFTYKASDGKSESAAVEVSITITPVDDDPGNNPDDPDDPDNPVSSGGGGGGGGICFINTLF